MRISTKGRYALRLMLDIAMNDAEGKPVRVKDIAKRQEVSGEVSGTDCFGADQGRIFKKYSWPPGWIIFSQSVRMSIR